MNKRSLSVKQWRINTKRKLVLLLGNKCYICGYNKCDKALQFHHIDPKIKKYSFSSLLSKPIKFSIMIQQLKKCICVCSNCHDQIHAGLHDDIIFQNNINYNLLQQEKISDDDLDKCPVCGKLKKKTNIYCSKSCSSKSKYKVDWDKIDLKYLLQIKKLSYVQIGQLLGCSDKTVFKRAKKLNLKSRFSIKK